MEGYIWLILASMLAVGIIFGYFIGRGREVSPSAQIRELEDKLTQQQQDMDQYKSEVTDHFGKTAELFNQLTNDYRAVYEHLANSSEQLCGDQVEKLKALTSDSGEKPAIESEEVSREEEEPAVAKAQGAGTKAEFAEEPVDQSEQQAKSEESEEVATAVTEESKLDDKAAEARTIH